MANIHIGISGWRYAPWRGKFYPPKLAQARELDYASRQLPTIEINGSFYSLQRPESYAAWYAATPPGFLFAVKGNRFITHMLKLKDVDGPLANVLASGVFALREKLGPFLWQFPEMVKFDPERFEHFLSILPQDTESGLALARRHQPRIEGKVFLEMDERRPMRHAVEVRHESFRDARFIALLRKYNVALVVADTAGRWPYMEDVTADFVYIRLHGDKELYASGYDDEATARWAARIRAWSTGGQPDGFMCASTSAPPQRASRDVYCYFDNDIKVHAPYDAQRLLAALGLR
ncbi:MULTISPECIES: DUF72 domain-containing protein [unclassified Massilia]|uniref:DUF72 domain-containing protein n=1 Tax=unclassified Massilia TaxID=2609279 RepID=UPI00177C845D|nr:MULTISPECIES: DUF72 domain-containing protein [unclassified Massilia]MBD8532690.1 DUF72 domain-containing protein [Massilia sp. CFBP 13647]MBD8676051.1 DUF72 domain-containing protein [Massilia sp. CFBP 13721]